MISKEKKIISFTVTAAALAVLFLLSVNTGSIDLSPMRLIRGLFISYDPDVATVYDLRFPRDIHIYGRGNRPQLYPAYSCRRYSKILWQILG